LRCIAQAEYSNFLVLDQQDDEKLNGVHFMQVEGKAAAH